MNTYILTSNFVNDLITAASQGINWAIKVSIFATAIFLAISLIAWMIHRS